MNRTSLRLLMRKQWPQIMLPSRRMAQHRVGKAPVLTLDRHEVVMVEPRRRQVVHGASVRLVVQGVCDRRARHARKEAGRLLAEAVVGAGLHL